MTEPPTCIFLRGVIALCTHRGFSPENIEAWDKSDKWVADLWRKAEAALATPQPTHAQAGAVPLTDEQTRAMLNKHPPEDVCGWSYRMGIDDAELHHGIKGGQHDKN